MAETMMLGLRLIAAGVSRQAFLARHGVPIEDQFGSQISRMQVLGLLVADPQHVRLSRRGIMLANSVCAEFL
jgi:oxygen-independent coproporphyrinogen-3 oxidase